MKILLINTSERIGGAAVAASRLTEALNNHGVKAKLLVRDKQTERLTVAQLQPGWHNVWRFVWERVAIWAANRFRRHQLFAVDIANTGTDITRSLEFQQADVIHLHWVNQGMLSLKDLGRILDSGKPVVWTMHDMWPCTGICHHARQCTRYRQECHHCPYLYGGGSRRDLSTRIFRRKQKLYARGKIGFVACSHWLEGLARQSALLQGQEVCSIPNPLDTRLFKPADRREARTRCGLPQAPRLILFGSVKTTDKRKGIDYLVEACRLMANEHPRLGEQLAVVVVGKNSEQLESLFPFKVYPLDFVSEDRRMAEIYNAVDLFVTPSLEENLPNTIMEAMACGTPCVGFEIGGIPEMIDHLHNGYVARYQSARDLAEGILWALDEENYAGLSEQARRKAVACYSESSVAQRYIDLYNQLLNRS